MDEIDNNFEKSIRKVRSFRHHMNTSNDDVDNDLQLHNL